MNGEQKHCLERRRKMKDRIIYSMSIAFIVTMCSFSFSVETINYQGVLKDSDGFPMASGSYNMRFTLFDAATNGTQLWQEDHTGAHKVSVIQGNYAVELGSLTAFGAGFFNTN